MLTVDILKARRRFGARKQWRVKITAANNERIDWRDTYANAQDAINALTLIRDSDIRVRVHYDTGVRETVWRAEG